MFVLMFTCFFLGGSGYADNINRLCEWVRWRVDVKDSNCIINGWWIQERCWDFCSTILYGEGNKADSHKDKK